MSFRCEFFISRQTLQNVFQTYVEEPTFVLKMKDDSTYEVFLKALQSLIYSFVLLYHYMNIYFPIKYLLRRDILNTLYIKQEKPCKYIL